MRERRAIKWTLIVSLLVLGTAAAVVPRHQTGGSDGQESWTFSKDPPTLRNHVFELNVTSENLTASLLTSLLAQSTRGTALPADKDRWAITVTGKLRLGVTRNHDGSEAWAARFHDLDLVIKQDGRPLSSEVEAATFVLNQPIVVHVNAHGAFQDLSYQKTSSILANSLPRLLLGMLQAQRPAQRRVVESWQTQEQESFARVTTRYSFDHEDAAYLWFEKAILSASPDGNTTHPDATTKVTVTGPMRIGFDRDTGLLSRVTTRRTIRSTLRDILVATSSIAFDLRFVGTRDDPITPPTIPSTPPVQETFTQDTTADQDKTLAKATMGDTDPNDLLDNLDVVETLPFTTQQGGALSQIKFGLKLEAALTLDEAFATRLADEVLKRSGRDPALVLMMSALANVGSGACEAALLKIARGKPQDTDVQYLALQALGLVRMASPEGEAFLRAVARESRDPIAQSTAALSLGSVAKTLHVTAPKRTEAIVSEAVRLATTEKTEGPRNLAIAVLGNAGTPEAERTLLALARAAEAPVRKEAAAALSVVTTPSATEALFSLGTTDADHEVRHRSLQSLSGRRLAPTRLAVLDAAFRASKDPWEKRLLISVAAGISPLDESILAFFEQATKDDDQTVRQHAVSVQLTLLPQKRT